MKLALIISAALLVSSMAAPTRAESWIFAPSYYSHDPVTQVRIGRQYSSGPVYTRPSGEYVRTGYRNLRSTIQVRGQTFDHLNVWESWIQTGAQF